MRSVPEAVAADLRLVLHAALRLRPDLTAEEHEAVLKSFIAIGSATEGALADTALAHLRQNQCAESQLRLQLEEPREASR